MLVDGQSGLTLFFVLLAVFAPLISPYGFDQYQSGGHRFAQLAHPRTRTCSARPCSRPTCSRASCGARRPRSRSSCSPSCSGSSSASPLGLFSGYFGGWLDRELVLIIDSLFAFPTLLLAIVIVVSISGGSSGKWTGIFATAIAITVVYVPQYFRVVRNPTIAAREEPMSRLRVPSGQADRDHAALHLRQRRADRPGHRHAERRRRDSDPCRPRFPRLSASSRPRRRVGARPDNAVQLDVSYGIWWTGVYPGARDRPARAGGDADRRVTQRDAQSPVTHGAVQVRPASPRPEGTARMEMLDP